MVVEFQTNHNPELYDITKGYDDDTGIKYAPNLSDDERRRATVLYRFFNELWGVMAVVGDPGTGKDVFGNYLQHTMGRYFVGKRLLRDEKPRPLFGHFDGLFNEHVLSDELKKMKDLASTSNKVMANYINALDKAAGDWVSNEGVVKLKNSILYLTEWWRYCNKREPFSPMNRTMGGIHKEKRHIDTLIIGTTQLESDLDKYTCKPFIDWRVKCFKDSKIWGYFGYHVTPVKYEPRLDVLEPLGNVVLPIYVDAAKPRPFLGNGKIELLKPYYEPETEEEEIILYVLKNGYNTYENIVELLYDKGDMSEREVLMTLKDLCFTKRKRVINYPCYFKIFNSKSVPNISTTLKVEE